MLQITQAVIRVGFMDIHGSTWLYRLKVTYVWKKSSKVKLKSCIPSHLSIPGQPLCDVDVIIRCLFGKVTKVVISQPSQSQCQEDVGWGGFPMLIDNVTQLIHTEAFGPCSDKQQHFFRNAVL